MVLSTGLARLACLPEANGLVSLLFLADTTQTDTKQSAVAPGKEGMMCNAGLL